MTWLERYLECSRDRTALAAGLKALDGMVERDADFRNGVYRYADRLGFPRCPFRPAETVCEGLDAWAKFTAVFTRWRTRCWNWSGSKRRG